MLHEPCNAFLGKLLKHLAKVKRAQPRIAMYESELRPGTINSCLEIRRY